MTVQEILDIFASLDPEMEVFIETSWGVPATEIELVTQQLPGKVTRVVAVIKG